MNTSQKLYCAGRETKNRSSDQGTPLSCTDRQHKSVPGALATTSRQLSVISHFHWSAQSMSMTGILEGLLYILHTLGTFN